MKEKLTTSITYKNLNDASIAGCNCLNFYKGVAMFNALQYTRSLEESGFERDQAEILVRMFMQMIEFNMVTKSDFEKFRLEVSSDFEKFRAEVNSEFSQVRSEFEKFRLEVNSEFSKVRSELSEDINDVRTELRGSIADVRSDIEKLSMQLTIKLGVMLAISMGLISSIIALKL